MILESLHHLNLRKTGTLIEGLFFMTYFRVVEKNVTNRSTRIKFNIFGFILILSMKSNKNILQKLTCKKE